MNNVIFVLQQITRERVSALRSGLGDAEHVIALGLASEVFWHMPGIDALYLSLTRAERWGSAPLSPHTAKVLLTNDEGRRDGLPPAIVTGLVLHEDDPNTGAFCVPLILRTTLDAVEAWNQNHPDLTIRTVGFFDFELNFPDLDLRQLGQLVAKVVR